MDQNSIRAQVIQAVTELSEAGRLQPGAQIVVGCSTSEIAGGKIGKASVPEIGEWVAGAVIRFCESKGYVPVFQCCEHLNRSLVIPLSAAKESGYTRVNAVPQPKAGGSVPAAAWTRRRPRWHGPPAGFRPGRAPPRGADACRSGYRQCRCRRPPARS